MSLRILFSKYYREMAGTIYVSEVPRREFMFRGFDGKVRRHMAFDDLDHLRRFLADESPLHAYYSVSLYRNPTAPMEEKDPIRAELLFDIDSTDLSDEECERESLWRCRECGYSGKGLPPARCPRCGSERIEVNHWLNERCISLTKDEVGKLVNILSEELGASSDHIAISYTGNRGFHVRVSEGKLTELTKDGRREVAFYVMGRGFDPQALVLVGSNGLIRLDSRSGIVRRIGDRITSDPSASKDPLMEVLHRLLGEGAIIKPWGRKRIFSLIRDIAAKSGANIDWMVTADTGRLTRIPNSLHGKTGFRALRLTLDEYGSFDPFKDAVGLPDEPEIKVRVKMPIPRFRLKNEMFGPYSTGDEVKLPGFAAAFVVLRERAEQIGGDHS